MSHYYSSPIIFFLHFLCCIASSSDVFTGYQMTLAVPTEYTPGFIGKALLMETHSSHPPSFWTALSVEASDDVAERYSCSLDLFLGSVKVWSSGHRSKFYAAETCVLELTHHGDLRLKDSTNQVGWRTGTADQGVQKLQLLDAGNLVLVDALAGVKWQTFNFPTDVLLLGQRLSVATHLLSYPPASSSSSTFFYSMEIQHDKLALYVNMAATGNNSSGYKDVKYSYWEYEPAKGRNITFVELTPMGLDLFDDAFRKFAQIYHTGRSTGEEEVRFMALDNSTGNLGLYYYHKPDDKFATSFEALNSSCDLPMACSNYSVCTRGGGCSCIALTTGKEGEKAEERVSSDCGLGFDGGCEREVEMVELQGAVSVLRTGGAVKVGKKEECGEMCLNDCECLAVMYREEGDCEMYDVVRGVKEGGGGELLVKVGKGGGRRSKGGGLNKWVLVAIVVADGLVLFLVVGGLGYFFFWKNSSSNSNSNSH